MDAEHHRKLERMYLGAPINRFFHPQIRIDEGRAEVSMPAGEHLYHAAGAVHGSAYFKLLDDASFFAASSLVEDVFVLTVSFNLYLVRPVTAGELRAEGRVVTRTGRLLFTEAILRDAAGVELARGSGVFTLSKTPLGPEIGYL